jgi:hypothetical protein
MALMARGRHIGGDTLDFRVQDELTLVPELLHPNCTSPPARDSASEVSKSTPQAPISPKQSCDFK